MLTVATSANNGSVSDCGVTGTLVNYFQSLGESWIWTTSSSWPRLCNSKIFSGMPWPKRKLHTSCGPMLGGCWQGNQPAKAFLMARPRLVDDGYSTSHVSQEAWDNGHWPPCARWMCWWKSSSCWSPCFTINLATKKNTSFWGAHGRQNGTHIPRTMLLCIGCMRIAGSFWLYILRHINNQIMTSSASANN